MAEENIPLMECKISESDKYSEQIENSDSEENTEQLTKFESRPTYYKYNNINDIREYCIENDILFEDIEFPVPENDEYEWKRPSDIVENPKFFIEGASRFDVKQGYLGNCWFLASVAVLTLHEDVFYHVVPEDQSFEIEYVGAFYFRFWRYGEWIEIVVDDRLPTLNGELIYQKSMDSNEFWSALLEKAYAKLHGSYEALEGGRASNAMEDFTGGITECYILNNAPSELPSVIQKAYERSSFISAGITDTDKDGEDIDYEGLVSNHAYSVTRVEYIYSSSSTHEDGRIFLLRIRNPWGNATEWKGSWSDSSPLWDSVSEEEKERIGLDFNPDGEFWIQYEDFIQKFSDIEICHVNLDTLLSKVEDEEIISWNRNIFHGEWMLDISAGGCINNIASTYYLNPQYLITLSDEDKDEDDGKCSIVIALMQKNRRGRNKELLTIGFSVHDIEDVDNVPAPLDNDYLKRTYNTSVKNFINSRQICERVRLNPGTYCIIPSTFNPDEEGEFMLRIFSETKNNIKENDQIAEYKRPSNYILAQIAEKDGNTEELRNLFNTYAGEDNEIETEELQNILNTCLREEVPDGFTKNICRSMLATKDIDFSGKLKFEEFNDLWYDICSWKTVFSKYATTTSGLAVKDLQSALTSAGYTISKRVLNVLIHRYADRDRQMKLDDFLMCAFRLKTMFEIFKTMSDDSKFATFELDEWLQKTLYS